jgi:hypothetical protein
MFTCTVILGPGSLKNYRYLAPHERYLLEQLGEKCEDVHNDLGSFFTK